MASTSTKAILSFVKILVALGAGYAVAYVWAQTRADADLVLTPDYAPYIPYMAGLVVAVMVFALLTKLNKGSGD